MIGNLIEATYIGNGQSPEIDRARRFEIRVYSALAVILYPLWGSFFKFFDLSSFDPMKFRLAISGGCLLLFGLTFIKAVGVSKLRFFINAMAYVFSFHNLYLLQANQLRTDYALGSMVIITALSFSFSSMRAFGAYALFVFAGNLVLAVTMPQAPFNFVFFAGQLTLLVFLVVEAKVRAALVKALEVRDTTSLSQRWLKNEYASKMAALGKMAGSVAHEINNPLAIIGGRASQLKEMAARGPEGLQGKGTDFAVKSLEGIEKNCERIARVVNALRSYTKDGFQNAFHKVSLKSVIEDTLSFCSVRMSQLNVQFTSPEIPEDLIVECQKSQLSQVLLSLLTNSLDAVEKQKEPWVRLELKNLGEDVEISVTDSGQGIAAEFREKIMEPFFTTKEAGKAMGLGLSISKSFVEGHHGKLFLDSDSSNTRFVVRLPICQELAVPKAAA